MPPARAAGRRIGLVIGINDYSRRQLRTAVKDAERVAAVLREMGFIVVLLTDADMNELDQAVNSFCNSLSRDDIGPILLCGSRC